MRTGRHLAQRTATEAECNALSEESSGHVSTVDVKLKAHWIEAFGNVAPHQLTSDIEEINSLYPFQNFIECNRIKKIIVYRNDW